MLRNNQTFQEDLNGILSVPFIPWEQLRNKSVFITGATGLIGYTLICALLQYNLSRQGNSSAGPGQKAGGGKVF